MGHWVPLASGHLLASMGFHPISHRTAIVAVAGPVTILHLLLAQPVHADALAVLRSGPSPHVHVPTDLFLGCPNE